MARRKSWQLVMILILGPTQARCTVACLFLQTLTLHGSLLCPLHTFWIFDTATFLLLDSALGGLCHLTSLSFLKYRN